MSMGMGTKGTPDEALAALRRTSFGIAVVLVIQYAFGMWVNAYDGRPPTGNGIGSAFGHALTSTPAVLAIHTWLGIVLFGGSIHTLMTAMGTKRPALMATSVVGLLCMIGASVNGAAFVNHRVEARSITMALLTGLALLCYLVNTAAVSGASRSGAATPAGSGAGTGSGGSPAAR